MSDDSKYPTRIAPYGLRMPPDLKSRVEASATKNQRSLNAEIVAALEEKYPPPASSDSEYFAEALKVTLNRLKVTPPKGMTIDDVVRVATTDFMLGEVDLDTLGEQLRREAIERQARKDAMSDEGKGD